MKDDLTAGLAGKVRAKGVRLKRSFSIIARRKRQLSEHDRAFVLRAVPVGKALLSVPSHP